MAKLLELQLITISVSLSQGNPKFARFLSIQRNLSFNIFFSVLILFVDPFVLDLVSILLAVANVLVTYVPE